MVNANKLKQRIVHRGGRRLFPLRRQHGEPDADHRLAYRHFGSSRHDDRRNLDDIRGLAREELRSDCDKLLRWVC